MVSHKRVGGSEATPSDNKRSDVRHQAAHRSGGLATNKAVEVNAPISTRAVCQLPENFLSVNETALATAAQRSRGVEDLRQGHDALRDQYKAMALVESAAVMMTSEKKANDIRRGAIVMYSVLEEAFGLDTLASAAPKLDDAKTFDAASNELLYAQRVASDDFDAAQLSAMVDRVLATAGVSHAFDTALENLRPKFNDGHIVLEEARLGAAHVVLGVAVE